MNDNNKFKSGGQAPPKSGARHSGDTRISTRQLSLYWLPVVGLCSAIFVQSSFAIPDSVPSILYLDKWMHLLTYGLLAALVCRAANIHARWHRRWWPLLLLGVAAASLYGLSDEWHQSFVPGRNASVADLGADFVGSALGSSSYLWGLRRVMDRRRHH